MRLFDRKALVYVHPDPTTPSEQRGPRRPFLRRGTLPAIQYALAPYLRPLDPPVLPANWVHVPEPHMVIDQRLQARTMSLAETCRRMAWVIAVTVGVMLAVSVSADSNPILALDAARIGRMDVATTITFLPSPDNLAVCVGLTAPQTPTEWACRFIPEVTDTTVTINWVVPVGTYTVEAGLWRAHRPTIAGTKVSETFTRVFGKVRL